MKVLQEHCLGGDVGVEMSDEQRSQSFTPGVVVVSQHRRHIVVADECSDRAMAVVGRIVPAIPGVHREADQPLGLERGERLVDVGQDT
jgi:hypothetical protein